MVNPGCSSCLGGRAPSIPEGHDLSRSSSNASSFASVVEENEATEDYDTGLVSDPYVSPVRQHLHLSSQMFVFKSNMCVSLSPPQESVSSAGTPHKRDSFSYTNWLEDSMSSTSTNSRASSPGERDGEAGRKP